MADDPRLAGEPDLAATGQVYRRVADEYLYVSRFHDPFEVAVSVGRTVGMHAETDIDGIARLEGDPRESGELLGRPGDLRDDVVQVQLHHLIARIGADVA